jgi:hypothetical protein
MNNNSIIAQVDAERPITYKPLYRTIMGSAAGAVLLSQIMYWLSISRNGGSLYINEVFKTDLELLCETGLSEAEIKTGKKSLKEKISSISVLQKGMPRKTFYVINWDEWGKEVLQWKLKHREKTIKLLEKIDQKKALRLEQKIINYNISKEAAFDIAEMDLNATIPQFGEINRTDANATIPQFGEINRTCSVESTEHVPSNQPNPIYREYNRDYNTEYNNNSIISFSNFAQRVGQCNAKNRNGSPCSRKKVSYTIDEIDYCTQHGKKILTDFENRGIKISEIITKESLPPKETFTVEAELFDYWVTNVRDVVFAKRNYTLTAPFKSETNLRRIKALINRIVKDKSKREDIIEPVEIVKFIFDNECARWINAKPWGGQEQPLCLLEFELLTRPHLANKKVLQRDVRANNQTSEKSLLEKVKNADAKIFEFRHLSENEFLMEMNKLSYEEAAYLILTEKLSTAWYNHFFGSNEDSSKIEIFKAMAIVLGRENSTFNQISSSLEAS